MKYLQLFARSETPEVITSTNFSKIKIFVGPYRGENYEASNSTFFPPLRKWKFQMMKGVECENKPTFFTPLTLFVRWEKNQF